MKTDGFFASAALLVYSATMFPAVAADQSKDLIFSKIRQIQAMPDWTPQTIEKAVGRKVQWVTYGLWEVGKTAEFESIEIPTTRQGEICALDFELPKNIDVRLPEAKRGLALTKLVQTYRRPLGHPKAKVAYAYVSPLRSVTFEADDSLRPPRIYTILIGRRTMASKGHAVK